MQGLPGLAQHACRGELLPHGTASGQAIEALVRCVLPLVARQRQCARQRERPRPSPPSFRAEVDSRLFQMLRQTHAVATRPGLVEVADESGS